LLDVFADFFADSFADIFADFEAEVFIGLRYQALQSIEAVGFASEEALAVMSLEVGVDLFEVGEGGERLGGELEANGTFSLEFAEFCEAAVKDGVGQGAGSVDGFLLGGDEIVPYWVKRHGGFDDAATAETRGSGHDFGGEGFFEIAFGRELGVESGVGFGVFFGFIFADEIVGGEQSTLTTGDVDIRPDVGISSGLRRCFSFGGVAGGDGFADFGSRAGRAW
jgi:hypothetical protein